MNKRLMGDGSDWYMEIEDMGGESYEYEMLQANSVESLLPVHMMKINEKQQLIYSASGYKTLEHYFEKGFLDGSQLIHIGEAILEGRKAVERYLLLPDNLVLDKDCIFENRELSQLRFIYVPGYQKDFREQLTSLLECLLEKIQQSDVRSVMAAWKIHLLLKQKEINLEELERTLCFCKESILGADEQDKYKETGYYEIAEKSPGYDEFRGKEMGYQESDSEEAYNENNSNETVLLTDYESQTGNRLPFHNPAVEKAGVRLADEEGKRVFGKKEKKKWRFSFALYLCAIITVLLGIGEVLVLCLIYAGGIQIWKRNLFLLNSFFLVISIILLLSIIKKEKEKFLFSKIKEKAF